MQRVRCVWARAQQWLQGPRLPALDPELAGREKVFRAPPFTPEIVAAIRLIAPQFALRPDEASRRYWEADQNGACWGEYEALRSVLEKLPAPAKVLEIGPGLGRSVVFFRQKLDWQSAEYHLYEGGGETTRYTLLGPRFEDSFCGNLAVLRQMLAYNEVENVTIHDAHALDGRLSRLPGPYDIVYGFYSIGFHWSLEHFFDEVLALLHETSVAFFTVPQHFEPFPALAEVPHRVLRWNAAWPKGREHRILLLSKSARPGLSPG
ncbi:MAG: hypothetical protein OEW02_00580 [Myxococcales bacterium]|nr:hypothetical protein [Myxococcales bacterium]MDH5567023.1 hypothetical protein [Myxococcales bacterium]